MNQKKQKKLLITFCVFLLLWNFPLISLFESDLSGAKSLWVVVSVFFSWLLIIVLMWRIVSISSSGPAKNDFNE